MKKVFVVWLNLYWEATMVRPVVMIICSLLLPGPPREIWGPGAKFDLGALKIYLVVLISVRGVRGHSLPEKF